ncbi:MAG: hypothetical protein JWO05_681 [Gemmatimonadetes bacterium]|nr:hypothetical protein [Gemmatimonadota bacterium]
MVSEARAVSLPGYRVLIGAGLLAEVGALVREAAPAHRYAVISDDVVAPLYARHVGRSLGAERSLLAAIPAGEVHKSRESWMMLTDNLLAAGCGRDTTIIALGGGVVGDLAGFVAATYMRGVPVVQLPTTLLAMVDASVGGKTGVDTMAGKNLVGAFHPPSLVIADVSVLASLPVRQRRSGIAEMIKHGVTSDARHFEHACAAAPALASGEMQADELSEIIAASIAIKAAVVTADEREQGLRKTLNFGHTLGHAIEAESGYELLHGEAIAIGMVLEAMLAERIGVAERGLARTIAGAVRAARLPHSLPAQMDAHAVLARTLGDKKSREGRVEYALPSAIGAMAGADGGYGIAADEREVLAVLSGPEA